MPILEALINTPPVEKKKLRMLSFSIDPFLAAETKKRDLVKGDGICIFRAVSEQLFGTDVMHTSMWSYVAEVIQMNSPQYSQHFIP